MKRRQLATVAVAVAALAACGGEDSPQLARSTAASAEGTSADSGSSLDAEAQLAAMQAMFPIVVTDSLEGYDVVGGYTMSLQQAYCDGLPDCNQPEPDVHADIIQGSNGLELQIPTVLTTGLFAVSGSLFAVTDSDQIANPCGSTPRNSRVSITIFPGGQSIAADGTQTLTGLGASLLVEVNETANCGEGVIFFAAQLAPD
jgi:hypothetical protein